MRPKIEVTSVRGRLGKHSLGEDFPPADETVHVVRIQDDAIGEECVEKMQDFINNPKLSFFWLTASPHSKEPWFTP